jgi:hypothetical protein
MNFFIAKIAIRFSGKVHILCGWNNLSYHYASNHPELAWSLPFITTDPETIPIQNLLVCAAKLY